MLNKFKDYYKIIYNKEDLNKFFNIVKDKRVIKKFNDNMKLKYNIVGNFYYIRNNGQISFIKPIKKQKIIKVEEIKIKDEELFFEKYQKQNYHNNINNIINKEIVIRNPLIYKKQKIKFEKLNIKHNILIALINIIILINSSYNKNTVLYIQKIFIDKEFIEQILYKIIPYIATKNDLDKIYNNRLNYKKKKKQKNKELLFYSYMNLIYNDSEYKKLQSNFDNILLDNIIKSQIYETITKEEFYDYKEIIKILKNYMEE